ncbi:MAG TPA: PadR family transcriptional regulator [Conexibacter sp.]
MKQAVLGLIVERPGYGYELIHRFNQRLGAAWRLNASTVYAAIDDLYDRGFIVVRDEQGPVNGPPRRASKLIYEPTPAGIDSFRNWLTAPVGKVEPLRAEIFLKLALARQEYALPLLQVIDAQIDVCSIALAEQLAGYQLDPGRAREISWAVAAGYFINDAGIGRLQADLAWLRRVRAGVEALRVHGAVPVSMLLPTTALPPGWR